MKTGWAIAYGVMFGLLAAGLLYLVSSPPRGEAIRLSPPPTPAPILVHVAGSVAHPGIYALSSDSRVADALQAAGGYSHSADEQILNLVAFVEDGQRIWVPAKIESQPSSQDQSPAIGSPQANSDQAGELVNINTANQAELESLPEIGPAIALKIIDYRQVNGPFTSIDGIQAVSGIGPATFDRIKHLITVQ